MTSADQTFYGSDFGALQSHDPEIAGVLLSELGPASAAGCSSSPARTSPGPPC